jgi:hypothetical protein
MMRASYAWCAARQAEGLQSDQLTSGGIMALKRIGKSRPKHC